MMQFLLVIVVLLGLAILYVVVNMAKSLRTSVNALHRIESNSGNWFRIIHETLHRGNHFALFPGRVDLRLENSESRVDERLHMESSRTGFAVWLFQHGDWTIEENHCAPGYEPGAKPKIPNAFNGFRIRKEGVPRK